MKNNIKTNSKSLNNYIEKYYNNLSDEGKENYKKQVLIINTIDDYYNEVMNGGIKQYLLNSSKEEKEYLLNYLNEIKAIKNKELLEKFIEEKLDFEKFDIEFYNINEKEDLDKLIFDYEKRNLPNIFPELKQKLNVNSLDSLSFVKKYEELSVLYPLYLEEDDKVLNFYYTKKIKQLTNLNKRLHENDDFSHKVLDILMKSKDSVVAIQSSINAANNDYRKEEAKEIIIKNLKLINQRKELRYKFFSSYTELYLSKIFNIKI